MNYGELKAAITSYLWNRPDLVAIMPTWVALTEAQLNRRLTHRLLTLRSDASISSAFVSLPTDFVGVVSVKLAGTTPPDALEYRTIEAMDRLAESLEPTGRPQFYTIVGDELRLLPVPDTAYTVEMTYRRQVDALSADTDTNWVLTKHPDAYLYGALMQAGSWLVEDERVPLWGKLYTAVMDDVVGQPDVIATLQMQPSGAVI